MATNRCKESFLLQEEFVNISYTKMAEMLGVSFNHSHVATIP